MIPALELVPLPWQLSVRETAAGVYARMLFRHVPHSDRDVLRILASEIRRAFGRASEDLDWDHVVLDRVRIDRFLAHDVFVPKVQLLEPLLS